MMVHTPQEGIQKQPGWLGNSYTRGEGIVTGKGCQEGSWGEVGGGAGNICFLFWLLVSHRLCSLCKNSSSCNSKRCTLVLNVYKKKNSQADHLLETLYKEPLHRVESYPRAPVGFF